MSSSSIDVNQFADSLELRTILEQLAAFVTTAAADRVLANLPAPQVGSPYMTVPEAADYIRAKPQRIYDLLSARRLTRFKDGSRVLLSRAELDSYLRALSS